jgi:hypothetical protein
LSIAPIDVKAKIIQEENDKQSKTAKRKATSIAAGVLESFAASTAASQGRGCQFIFAICHETAE